MEAYAVIETGGKQYRVEKGNVLTIEKLEAEAGQELQVGPVLALSDGASLQVGDPAIEGAQVTVKVLEQKLGDKVVNFKRRRRKGYRRTVGHRQELTRVQVVDLK